jgi:hypothetical protein
MTSGEGDGDGATGAAVMTGPGIEGLGVAGALVNTGKPTQVQAQVQSDATQFFTAQSAPHCQR